MKDYLSVVYDNKKKPVTQYPYEFTRYNIKKLRNSSIIKSKKH